LFHYPSRESSRAHHPAAEGATGPRKRSGTKDRAGSESLESRRATAAPTEKGFSLKPESLRFRDRGGSDDPGNRHLTHHAGTKILSDSLKTTPLDALHRRLGARMTEFAGWSLPVQFAGTLAEHAHTRTAASLFDVSHMVQISLHGAEAAARLELLVPADILGLAPGRQRYTMLTNELGGIIDDLMVANTRGCLAAVLNASRGETDIAHLRTHGLEPEIHADRALLALQGPMAAGIMARLSPEAAALPFQGTTVCDVAGIACWVARSGYTGEDGFELSVPAGDAEALAEKLLAEPEVLPAGLAARDTLRLEAGLCLYGNDIDMLTSPIEAGLGWSIPKRRRASLDFLGAAVVADHLAHGPTRKRVGIRPEGRAPARAGVVIAGTDDTQAGTITSGGFSPTLGAPIAMGYVRNDLAAEGTPLALLVRGQHLPAAVARLPFVPPRFVR
jgi:aminomethyltransferase